MNTESFNTSRDEIAACDSITSAEAAQHRAERDALFQLRLAAARDIRDTAVTACQDATYYGFRDQRAQAEHYQEMMKAADEARALSKVLADAADLFQTAADTGLSRRVPR